MTTANISTSSPRNLIASIALLMLSGTAAAQELRLQPEPAASQTDIPTLDEVRALPPDEEPLDLYRFKNPIEVEPNRFDKAWSPPPTPEEVSMAGGYVVLGVGWVLYQGLKGLNSLTGGPGPIEHAVARPSPLDDAQLQRAETMCDADGSECAAIEPHP